MDPFTPIATLSTTDGVEDNIYSLVSGNTSDDNHLFTIIDDQLYLNISSDYEQETSYTVRIQSLDSSSTVMERVFDLYVTDVNESPYELEISSDIFDENLLAGSLIATISAQDPDDGDSLSYSLVSGDGDDIITFQCIW